MDNKKRAELVAENTVLVLKRFAVAAFSQTEKVVSIKAFRGLIKKMQESAVGAIGWNAGPARITADHSHVGKDQEKFCLYKKASKFAPAYQFKFTL